MKNTTEPHNFGRYSLWIRDKVVSQPLLFLNQLVFGCLEAYFQFKLGVKSSGRDLMMAGLLEAEKIFFFNRSNKNYQQAAAYRVSELIKMPAEMIKLKLKFQTTDATLANSFNLPGHTSLDDEPMNVDPADTFEETSNMKKNAPKGQGTDAALEQIIKRSKKGVKIKVGVFF